MSERPFALRRARPLSAHVEATDGAPPSSLAPDSFAARLYLSMAPVARLDSDYRWSLLILCNAIGTMYQLLDDLLRDTPDGPGWSILLDLDRCPPAALPWLAQLVGVRLPGGLTEQEQRNWISSTDGFRRGTRAAMIGAARATLTGARSVSFTERSGDPAIAPDYAYYLDVTTYTAQTPDPAATLRALLAQKPAGIVLRYAVHDGQSWQQVKDSGKTWAQINTDYDTWADVRNLTPG